MDTPNSKLCPGVRLLEAAETAHACPLLNRGLAIPRWPSDGIWNLQACIRVIRAIRGLHFTRVKPVQTQSGHKSMETALRSPALLPGGRRGSSSLLIPGAEPGFRMRPAQSGQRNQARSIKPSRTSRTQPGQSNPVRTEPICAPGAKLAFDFSRSLWHTIGNEFREVVPPGDALCRDGPPFLPGC